MQRVTLPEGWWEYDPLAQLGDAGGFGAVYRGRAATGDAVAVKRLHLSASEAAHRELRVVDYLGPLQFPHVIPFLGAGYDKDLGAYFVVMPIAEMSLQGALDQRGRFGERETLLILSDIAAGLEEASQLVHRDLKPANVLFHDGQWKISDFGIARFVEESTSLRTLKDCLSPLYAAPEQWRLERATGATDVYALGCIAHALLNGTPPFGLPALREQHLTGRPPELRCKSLELAALVQAMLLKSPEARPTLPRVQHLMQRLLRRGEAEGGAPRALARVGRQAVEAEQNHDIEVQRQRCEGERRASLGDEAFSLLGQLLDALQERILTDVPVAHCSRQGARMTAELMHATLGISPMADASMLPASVFRSTPWDVVAGAVVSVTQRLPSRYEWSANLWFTDMGQSSPCCLRWWEAAYMFSPLLPAQGRDEPFGVSLPEVALAEEAAGPGLNSVQLAYDPLPVDAEDTEAFLDRWCEIFSQACAGTLARPRTLPM
jgi:serine/threonine-protein kinase